MKTQETVVIKSIISVLHKYRVIAIMYVVLSLLGFVISIFQFHSNLRSFLSTLELLLPFGFVLAIFFNRENKIKLTNYIVIAGFVGGLVNLINILFIQIHSIASKTFINYDLISRYSTYLSMINIILLISIVILFLLIVVFNIISQKIGVWICTLIIISMVVSVIVYIDFFMMINIKDFIQVPVEFRPQLIINWVKIIIEILSGGIWMVIELLIIKGLLKSKPRTDIN